MSTQNVAGRVEISNSPLGLSVAERLAEGRRRAAERRASGEAPRRISMSDLRRDIASHCMWCMGGEGEAGYQRDIKNCAASPDSQTPCALWRHRPYVTGNTVGVGDA